MADDEDAIAAYLEQATASIRAGRLEEAAEAVKQVLARDPDDKTAKRFDEFLRGRLRPEVAIGSRFAPLADGFREDDPFADIKTAPASERLMSALAAAADDPFEAITAVDDVRKLAARGVNLDEWDAATTVAIAAANLLQMLTSVDEDDGPSLPAAAYTAVVDDNSDFDTPVRTIAIVGSGVAIAFAEAAARSPLLSRLPLQQRQALLSRSEVVQCFAGQTIVSQDDEGVHLHLVVSGEVALERASSEGTYRVATARPGDFFGECALLGNRHTATARVLVDALTIEVSLDLIKELVATEPELLTVLSRTLRARLLLALRRESPVYRALPPEQLSELDEHMHLYCAREGISLVRCGEIPDGLWTVMSGELERRETSHTRALSPFATFGRESLHGETASVDIVATSACWLVCLLTRKLSESARAELIAAVAAAVGV